MRDGADLELIAPKSQNFIDHMFPKDPQFLYKLSPQVANNYIFERRSSTKHPLLTSIMNNTNDADLERIALKSPQSIDHILPKEFLELSLRDRNAIDEEVHGVSTLAPKESPEFLEASLQELSKELNAIPDDDPLKAAYIDSQVLHNTYVNTSDFRLRFLRCELFNAKKAALRMVNFLDFASDLFGPQVLERQMRITDFSRDEKKQMGVGIVQILPYRDQSGRPIYAVVDFKQASLTSRYRIALYLQYCLSDDLESQRKGFIQLFWIRSTNVTITSTNGEYKYIRKLHQSTPIRTCATHWCMPKLPLFHPVHVMRCGHTLSLGKERPRVRFHTGDKVELLYKLKTFGIPSELVPVTDTGNIKTIYLKQWMRFRKHYEKLRAEGNPDVSTITLIPRSNDVVFRGGTFLKCHPGNFMFESLIEAKLQEHSSASQKEKIAITKTMISAIQQKEGRFFQWEARGWWKELKDTSQVHSKVAEKVRKLTAKLVAQQQAVWSSTIEFQNQDHSKRRKLVSREDSGDSSSSFERCCLSRQSAIEEK